MMLNHFATLPICQIENTFGKVLFRPNAIAEKDLQRPRRVLCQHVHSELKQD